MLFAKRKSMAKVVVMCCVAALTAFAGIAQANEGGLGGEQCAKQQRHNFKKMEKKLGLTDAQKAQAKAVFQANKGVVTPILEKLRAEREKLAVLIHADAVDEAAIRAESATIAGLLADLNVNRAKAGVQFRAILTPAQLAILKTLQQKHHKMGGHMPDIPAE